MDETHRVATNLRRILARFGMTEIAAAEAGGLSERTIRYLKEARKRPNPQTIKKLADGLGIDPDEFYADPHAHLRAFDRATNPVVDEVREAQPELFDGWAPEHWDELYSRRGVGGELTEEGVVHFASHINERRELFRKATSLLETSKYGPIVADLINDLHRCMEASTAASLSHAPRSA